MIRRVIAAVFVLGACAAAVLFAGASNDDAGKSGKELRIVLDNAFGLTEGGDLRVAGTPAGETTGFEVTDEDRPKAVVLAKVSEPGFDSFRKDARCEVRQQSLIGEYYVDCQLGTSKESLPNNTVPVTQTASTVPLDLINNIQRRPYRERLRLIINELGTGLAGRPEDLSQVIRRAHPGLRETSRTLAILGRQNKIIQNFIADSDTVVKDLDAKKRDVVRWIEETGETSAITATRREQLAEQFRRFPGFLDQLQPTMARLGALTDEQTPLLRELRTAAPDLERTFTELGPFSKASTPSIKSLGGAAASGRKAINTSRDEVRELRALAADAPRMGKPLRQFLQTIDDRGRYYEPDKRAGDTAPPAPDPVAYKDGTGFTGMEAVWNYLYWQTLAINPFDEVSHFLRAVLNERHCGSYAVKPDAELQKECGRYLGPYQPGVNAPDPLEDTSTSAAASKRQSSSGGQRGAGEPEATKPRAGERDISKPHVVLPPELEKLVDKLRRLPKGEKPQLPANLPQLPQAPSTPQLNTDGPTTTEQLLNYLLAP